MKQIKRDIIAGEDLKASLKRGIDKLANTVKTTMGPKGKLVLIQRPGQHPTVTKDGVTVANAINLEDEVENLGAQIIKESAARTADQAGDGTTTATVLAQSIFTEGLKMIAAGFDPVGIKKGIQLGVASVVESLESKKQSVVCQEDLMKVALISANGEEEIAKLIVDAIDAAGVDGHVIVEEAKGFKSNLTIVDGYQVERGYLSPYFVTDKNKMICEFKDPMILVADRSFNTIHELMKPLEVALDKARPILVIANDIDGDAMQGLVLNRVKGSLRVCAIKSPGFGATRHELLNDLESIIGGTVINSSFDMQNCDENIFGTCKKVIIHKGTALFINDQSSKEKDNVLSRIKIIKDKLKHPGLDPNEKELLEYRLQQLSGGIAILRVGASTESELIERYDRVDDALNATKAAIQEGIVPGGGVAFIKSISNLDKIRSTTADQSVNAGLSIVAAACHEPFNQIILNSGKSPEVLLSKIKESDDFMGYDSRNDKLDNMFKLGVVDPCKVVRCAIENAASAASMLLSAGSAMVEIDEGKT
jgi:chaperonin GroEL